MNDIQIFKNEEFGEVRTLVVNSEPWFVGSNVATILGYTNPQKAIRDHVDDDDKLTERIVLSGQNREVVIINESGMYSLILSSKLPTAKKFKRWVTSEVLPAIRKTGGYMVAQQDETPEQLMARALRVAEETLARQKAKMEQVQRENKRLNADNAQKEGEINILRPDAEYTRKTLTSVSTWNTNIIAKEMGMSAVTLNKKLQKLGVQYKQHDVWVISAKYEGKGYVKTQTYTYMKSGGETGTRLQMEWTERGRRFLHELHDKGRI